MTANREKIKIFELHVGFFKLHSHHILCCSRCSRCVYDLETRLKESMYLSMHLAKQPCSPEPNDVPGELTHFLKHLSVTFFVRSSCICASATCCWTCAITCCFSAGLILFRVSSSMTSTFSPPLTKFTKFAKVHYVLLLGECDMKRFTWWRMEQDAHHLSPALCPH